MIDWLALLRLALSAASWAAKAVHDRQLIDAGRMQAHMENLNAVLEDIKKAQDARASVSDDPDSLRNDEFNRDKP